MSVAVLIMLLIGFIVDDGYRLVVCNDSYYCGYLCTIAMEFGLSPLAIIALIGTAGALGDAGSPASDSTFGPTAGLNVDGQHNHIRDTCVPTSYS